MIKIMKIQAMETITAHHPAEWPIECGALYFVGSRSPRISPRIRSKGDGIDGNDEEFDDDDRDRLRMVPYILSILIEIPGVRTATSTC